MARTKKLPNKPSALIRVAMDDLNRVERLKGYVVDMNTWHDTFYEGEQCHVCFAGAVMAQTLKARPEQEVEPNSYDSDTSGKLLALDSFRYGEVGEAFGYMGLDFEKGMNFDRNFPPYSYDRRGFKLAMRKLARDLEAARL